MHIDKSARGKFLRRLCSACGRRGNPASDSGGTSGTKTHKASSRNQRKIIDLVHTTFLASRTLVKYVKAWSGYSSYPDLR